MVFLIAGTILVILVEDSFVGVTSFVLFGSRNSNGRNWKAIIFIFAAIAILDLMYLSFVSFLDMEIIIGNSEVANFLGPTGLHDLLTFEWSDILIWAAETFVAYIIGKRIVNKFRPINAGMVTDSET